MAHHVFRDENRVEHLAVVDGKSEAYKIGRDHRTPRPGLDRGFLIRAFRLLDFIQQVKIYKWTFLDGASHKSLLVLHRPAVAADQNKSVGKFLLVAGAISLGLQTLWRSQLLPATTTLGFTLTTTVWMIHRVARHTTSNRTDAAMT